MLDRNLLRSDPERVRAGAARKGMKVPIDEFLSLDEQFRVLKTEADKLLAESNTVSKSIGVLMSQGKKEEGAAAAIQAKELKERVSQAEAKVSDIEPALTALESEFPNLPHETVPDGFSESENQAIRSWGSKPEYSFTPKPHWEIAEKLGLIDFEAGGKISGSGFVVYKGLGAKMLRALQNYMLEMHTSSHGYTEIYPPLLVNRESLTGTGQLPKFEEDLYRTEPDDLFLIPTAEVPVTNLLRDVILDAEELPIHYAAFSHCFRREAGAAGKDTRGLLRVHEFHKVELVKFCTPENSYDELEKMTSDAENVLRGLGLHYRVSLLCAGEMSFSNAKCYDLEVWSPGVDKYLEVSSASNFEDFQARRAGIRYRPEKGSKPKFVHTLNASGTAFPRLMASLLETNQEEDGSVIIPPALRSFMGTEKISC